VTIVPSSMFILTSFYHQLHQNMLSVVIISLTGNHKKSNFLDCDWFKKLLFSTNSLAKLLSDSLLLDSSISQSQPWFQSP